MGRATAAEPVAYEREAGETARAYLAFRTYLELGPARTLSGVAAARLRPVDESPPPPGPAGAGRRCPSGYIKALSSKHRWVARAEVWDRHAEALSLREAEKLVAANAKVWEGRKNEIAYMFYDDAMKFRDEALALIANKPLSARGRSPTQAVFHIR